MNGKALRLSPGHCYVSNFRGTQTIIIHLVSYSDFSQGNADGSIDKLVSLMRSFKVGQEKYQVFAKTRRNTDRLNIVTRCEDNIIKCYR